LEGEKPHLILTIIFSLVLVGLQGFFVYWGLFTRLFAWIISFLFRIRLDCIERQMELLLNGRVQSSECTLTATFLLCYPVIIFIPAAIYYAKAVLKKNLSFLGFRNPLKDKMGILLAILLGFSYLAGYFAANPPIGIDENRAKILMSLPDKRGFIRPIYYLNTRDFLFSISVPFLFILFNASIEETIFRGLIQSVAAETQGIFSIFISSFFFAIAHFRHWGEPEIICSIFIASSILYGYLYFRKQNIFPSIILHTLHNFALWSIGYSF